MSASGFKTENRNAFADRCDDESHHPVTLSTLARGQVENDIEELKERLLEPILSRTSHPQLLSEIRWAANEAAALAWCTVCPVLVLPTLLEEKIRATLAKWDKQQRLRETLHLRRPAFLSLPEAA